MAAGRWKQLLLYQWLFTRRIGWCGTYPLHFRMIFSAGGWRGDACYTADHGPRDTNTDNEVFSGPIPRGDHLAEKLTVSFSRSSGPGGQNVNKLNTKAEVRFHVQSADWIPERVKHRVHSLYRSRITKSGELVISSQRYRTQHKNLQDAMLRLSGILKEASEVPKGPSELTVARVKALKRKADKQRRTEKKYLSDKKLNRKTFPTD